MRDFNSFFNSFTWLLLLTAAHERKRNEKVFETKNETTIGSTKQTARANSGERTNASAHAWPLLFVSSLFRPVFAHT